MRSNRRRGFTLMELMVAMTVGITAILGAHLVFRTLMDQADRVTGVAADLDRAGNGERVLRQLLGSFEMGEDSESGFGGNALRAAFSSWCQAPTGWTAPCRVTLAVTSADSSGSTDVLAALLSTGEALPLISGGAPIRLLYLGDAANGGRWVSRWSTSVTAPLAIGVVVDRDTLIVRIGERG